MALVFVVLVSLLAQVGGQEEDCGCSKIEAVSQDPFVVLKGGFLLGNYVLRSEKMESRPTYEHERIKGYYLYYNSSEWDGYWGVHFGLNGVGKKYFLNMGDGKCPYRLKSTWRYANNNYMVLEDTLHFKCKSDPCSIARCGHNAQCSIQGGSGSCSCKAGYYGDPYER